MEPPEAFGLLALTFLVVLAEGSVILLAVAWVSVKFRNIHGNLRSPAVLTPRTAPGSRARATTPIPAAWARPKLRLLGITVENPVLLAGVGRRFLPFQRPLPTPA